MANKTTVLRMALASRDNPFEAQDDGQSHMKDTHVGTLFDGIRMADNTTMD